MTDDEVNREGEEWQKDDLLAVLTRRPVASDPVLGLRIFAVNTEESGVGEYVTVLVGGLLISGQLVSPGNWFRDFGQAVTGGNTDELGHFEEIAAVWDDERPGEFLDDYPNYIHLRAARIWGAAQGAIPTSEDAGIPWRGRLSRVDAWFPGVVSSEES